MSHDSYSETPNLEKVMMSEADAWYKRNRHGNAGFEPSANFSRLLTEIGRLGFTPRSFLELGASDGYNLLAFEKAFPGSVPVVGIEASAMAVAYGEKKLGLRNSSAKLMQGSAHSLPFIDDSFDLVYVGFLLYLADYKLLSKFYGEAIRVLKPGGLLCLTDFFPTGSTPAYEHNLEIKIEKRDHVKSLHLTSEEKLSSIYFQVSSSSGIQNQADPQSLLSNLNDLVFDAILMKKRPE
jgi:SAM-dependent methyltransferase